jgi:hypothetical protein
MKNTMAKDKTTTDATSAPSDHHVGPDGKPQRSDVQKKLLQDLEASIEDPSRRPSKFDGPAAFIAYEEKLRAKPRAMPQTIPSPPLPPAPAAVDEPQVEIVSAPPTLDDLPPPSKRRKP